jgi:signal transduction histidine kinase
MRTPLEVVASTIDSLLEDPGSMSAPVATAMLERASRQVMKLRRLLPTLLQLGRLQLEGPGAARAQVDLRQVIDDVLRDLQPLDRTVTYQLEVDAVHADPMQLARVLVELVTHVTEHGPSDAPLRFGAIKVGVDVELFLDVDGYRMTEEVRQVIFSPFLGTGRGGEEANGDDLGLSLVAVYARMHGGRAWVQDAPNGGTSFRVLLSNALPDTHRESDDAVT